jgi:hypothetical protein
VKTTKASRAHTRRLLEQGLDTTTGWCAKALSLLDDIDEFVGLLEGAGRALNRTEGCVCDLGFSDTCYPCDLARDIQEVLRDQA